ncbi:pyridoxal-phosphate dependent enzyme [Marilutibacter chinensis]|uniref:Pyridoxal-phosphate dependent enzyme n=1 Tax=Marilutibacter chinensis TaxID=2912247 RepID=A0ABS9HYY4_9GAMM|nr:pyridoxal-phosphate dependent enzyme [Lysobacter chinensis]MCF7223575.1 pyridoxal-phosphate dependent enzyme [Lysobacter chinensis]
MDSPFPNAATGDPRIDPHALWPDYRPTRLLALPALARHLGIAQVWAKLESERPLGNFKSLGGSFAATRALALAMSRAPDRPPPRLVCASDGNHGLAVAVAAQRAGTTATVYLPGSVDAVRVARIAAAGAEIVRVDGRYDDAVAMAEAAAGDGAVLIADTSDDPDDPVVADVMSGYAVLVRELAAQLAQAQARPSHVFAQAGVGGLAAALVEGLQERMAGASRMLVVEPASAACVGHALRLGRLATVEGALATSASMLSCGRASAPALRILLRHRAGAIAVDEPRLSDAVAQWRKFGEGTTTTSGAAGLAGLLHVAAAPARRRRHGLDADSVAVLVISEAAPPSG